MDKLFVEVACSDNKSADVSEVFTSVQSFLALYVYRFLGSPANVKIVLVRTTLPKGSGKIKIDTGTLPHELKGEEEALCKDAADTQAINDLRLPIYAKDGNTYIAGTCAVCRELVKRQSCVDRYKLLGFKGSCLLAPAEASIWTRFCEVDVVDAVSSWLHMYKEGLPIQQMPICASRFERHMNEPVRMHNIYKLAREQAKGQWKEDKVIFDNSTPKEQLAIEHRFAEGVAFTIADLILYPCLRVFFKLYPQMLQHYPLTETWFKEVDAFESNCQLTLEDHFTDSFKFDSQQLAIPLNVPVSEKSSLYKSDPKRYKPRNRIYTEQSEVDASLTKLSSLQLEFNSDVSVVYDQDNIDWNTIEPEHEKSSALPLERLERKRQQLANLANAVAVLAETEDRIIDFCSGTGHLGILLALQLPHCTVILMENKAISLERAKKRATMLNLKNCRFYQCNIDYFTGNFDLGTSLHACGTATDIVLQQCRRSRAKFVCCPCCYGSLQPMAHISYPLSLLFRTVLNEKDFLHIAHTADQAHELGTANCKPETTRQGQLCMDIVDTDRKTQAEEEGYEVILTRLKPEQCTPKNRLLVGHIPAPGS